MIFYLYIRECNAIVFDLYSFRRLCSIWDCKDISIFRFKQKCFSRGWVGIMAPWWMIGSRFPLFWNPPFFTDCVGNAAFDFSILIIFVCIIFFSLSMIYVFINHQCIPPTSSYWLERRHRHATCALLPRRFFRFFLLTSRHSVDRRGFQQSMIPKQKDWKNGPVFYFFCWTFWDDEKTRTLLWIISGTTWGAHKRVFVCIFTLGPVALQSWPLNIPSSSLLYSTRASSKEKIPPSYIRTKMSLSFPLMYNFFSSCFLLKWTPSLKRSARCPSTRSLGSLVFGSRRLDPFQNAINESIIDPFVQDILYCVDVCSV